MNPYLAGSLLKLNVITPDCPQVISGMAEQEPELTVKYGLVRFGSKSAFLGCPLFHDNMAYSEAVLLTLDTCDGVVAEVIFETADAITDLIRTLEVARDNMVDSDERYDRLVELSQVWEAGRAEALESFPTLEGEK